MCQSPLPPRTHETQTSPTSPSSLRTAPPPPNPTATPSPTSPPSPDSWKPISATTDTAYKDHQTLPSPNRPDPKDTSDVAPATKVPEPRLLNPGIAARTLMPKVSVRDTPGSQLGDEVRRSFYDPPQRCAMLLKGFDRHSAKIVGVPDSGHG